jgi:hypothetical protein
MEGNCFAWFIFPIQLELIDVARPSGEIIEWPTLVFHLFEGPEQCHGEELEDIEEEGGLTTLRPWLRPLSSNSTAFFFFDFLLTLN